MKPIPDFDGYFADVLGRIYSMRPRNQNSKPPKVPRLLRATKIGRGYNSVALCGGSGIKPVRRKVAVLILETFVSKRPSGMLALHGKNGINDDSLSNLRWGTHVENMLDKKRDGTDIYASSENNGMAKLTASQVRVIRSCPKYWGCCNDLAERFGVNYRTISDIRNNKRWKHL